MPNDFLNISEATLWDNLKRKANKYLRDIQSDDKKNAITAFNEKYPEKIQKLLLTIGKEFFNIFYYHTIKNATLLETNKEEIEKIVEEITANFKFYFWPGYTTLAQKRIAIIGKKKVQI